MADRYNDIRELFHKADKSVRIDSVKKRETLEHLEQIRLNQTEQSALPPENDWHYTDFRTEVRTKARILKSQIYYMDKTILAIHLMVCLGIIFLGSCRQWGQISMIASGALGALSLFEVGNLFFSGMTELGESCYFNVRQLAAFQMVYSGVVSLAALMLATVSASLNYHLDFMRTVLFILVPFVFTECTCMTVMLMEIGRRNLLLLVAVGIFSALFWGVLASIPDLYEASALAFWGVALMAGIGMLAVQVRRFFNALGKGEILCAD